MKTIAVVGGTGFLGTHVVAALTGAGFSIRVLSRRTGFDARHPSSTALEGIDAVVNSPGLSVKATIRPSRPSTSTWLAVSSRR